MSWKAKEKLDSTVDGKAVKKKRYHIQRKWHARDFVEFQDFSVLGRGVGGGGGGKNTHEKNNE